MRPSLNLVYEEIKKIETSVKKEVIQSEEALSFKGEILFKDVILDMKKIKIF